jgi:hypothetical protein
LDGAVDEGEDAAAEGVVGTKELCVYQLVLPDVSDPSLDSEMNRGGGAEDGGKEEGKRTNELCELVFGARDSVDDLGAARDVAVR